MLRNSKALPLLFGGPSGSPKVITVTDDVAQLLGIRERLVEMGIVTSGSKCVKFA